MRALLPPLLLAACGGAAATTDWRGELLLSEQVSRPWSDSAFRRLATPPDHALDLEWRPDLSWQEDGFAATVRPRLRASGRPGGTQTDAWLNEATLRWRVLPGVSLQGGREVLLWGPGAFWNPSNPLFPSNNKENPKREIGGHDLLRARWQLGDAFALSAIGQFTGGHGSSGDDAYRRHALKLDWVGDEASAAALGAARPGRTPGYFGWLQWTASDALLLYGEAAWSADEPLALPRPAPTPTGWTLADTQRGRSFKGLLGASWTFENGWTLSGEWWRNGGGLDDAQARSLAEATAQLATRPPGLADAQLAALMNPATPLRRDYAGLQLINGSDAKLGWTLRYKRNLDDRSGEAFVMLKRDLGDAVQVWGNLMWRHGGADSEYGRWIARSAMVGVSWFQ